MKKILFYLGANIISILLLFGCSVPKYVSTETKTITNVKDSLVIKDSTVITPIEKVIDIVPQYNMLRLETSLAYSETFLDTTLHMLRGKIENKIQPKKEYKFKEHILTVKDTIYVEKPYPLEIIKYKTPKWSWYCLGVCMLFILGFILYFKLRV